MISGTGKLTTKAIAVIVIVAMLDAVGLSPVIMVFVTGVVFVVWLIARRAQSRETLVRLRDSRSDRTRREFARNNA